MAASLCPTCGAKYNAYINICSVCQDKLVQRKDLEPDNLAALQAAQERYERRLDILAREQKVDDVFNWRWGCLVDAGAPPEIAELVASWKVDLHRACEMFLAGCDPQLAQQILSPVE